MHISLSPVTMHYMSLNKTHNNVRVALKLSLRKTPPHTVKLQWNSNPPVGVPVVPRLVVIESAVVVAAAAAGAAVAAEES